MKVNFSEADAARLAGEARKRGLKRVNPELLRTLVMEGLDRRARSMPQVISEPKMHVALPEDTGATLKVWAKPKFSAAENAEIERKAFDCGETRADYMRKVVLADITGKPKPAPKIKHAVKVIAALAQVCFQIKKLGTNVNQLAHQANAGMVAVTRREVEYLMNQHQVVLSKAVAILESFAP